MLSVSPGSAIVPAGAFGLAGAGVRTSRRAAVADLAADLAQMVWFIAMVLQIGSDNRGRFTLARWADRTKHIGRGEAEDPQAAGRPPVYPIPGQAFFWPIRRRLVGEPLPGLAFQCACAARTRSNCKPRVAGNRRLRRRVGLGMARPRHQPAQSHPMQQAIGARQAALDIKLLLKIRCASLRETPPPSRAKSAPATIRSNAPPSFYPQAAAAWTRRSRSPSIPSSS